MLASKVLDTSLIEAMLDEAEPASLDFLLSLIDPNDPVMTEGLRNAIQRAKQRLPRLM